MSNIQHISQLEFSQNAQTIHIHRWNPCPAECCISEARILLFHLLVDFGTQTEETNDSSVEMRTDRMFVDTIDYQDGSKLATALEMTVSPASLNTDIN